MLAIFIYCTNFITLMGKSAWSENQKWFNWDLRVSVHMEDGTCRTSEELFNITSYVRIFLLSREWYMVEWKHLKSLDNSSFLQKLLRWSCTDIRSIKHIWIVFQFALKGGLYSTFSGGLLFVEINGTFMSVQFCNFHILETRRMRHVQVYNMFNVLTHAGAAWHQDKFVVCRGTRHNTIWSKYVYIFVVCLATHMSLETVKLMFIETWCKVNNNMSNFSFHIIVFLSFWSFEVILTSTSK